VARTGFKLDAGFKRLEMLLKPGRFQAALQKNMGQALAMNGLVAVKAIRKTIKEGVDPPNAGLTKFIKGSSKPLIDNADLWRAVTWKKVEPLAIFVGVLRTNDSFNVAKIVHDGASVRVTDKMRAMFFALWLASEGKLDPNKLKGRAAELWARRSGGWKPLGSGKGTITIPSRPFIEITFADASMKKKMAKNLSAAAARALHGK
jgi:hypothetical protein